MLRVQSEIVDFGVSMRVNDKREVKPAFYLKGEMFEIEESETHDARFDCR